MGSRCSINRWISRGTETYLNKRHCFRRFKEKNMAKKKSDSAGLMSSAGLMRYFEADSTAIKVDPKTVVGACVASGAAIMALNIAFRLWP